MPGKGASLLPQDYVTGGGIEDGKYKVKSITTAMFDYGGTQPEAPALKVVLLTEDKQEKEQMYSAGKADRLVPSADGKRFEHPNGEEAHIGKGSNAALLIMSFIDAGFPTANLSDDVTAFDGTEVEMVQKAQPKRPGVADQKEGKTIALVAKIIKLPGAGAKAVATKPTTAKAAAAATKAAPAAVAATADLDASAIALIKDVLAGKNGEAVTVAKLSTDVMLKAAKDPATKANMKALKTMAGDATFLDANMTDNWVFDAEAGTVTAWPE